MYHPSLYTPLTDILGCQFPILCAGMGGVARHRLAAAVSNAGGFGCLGMVREQPEFIREEVRRYRAMSDKPFAVNLIPAATNPMLLKQQINECIALEVQHIVFFWDVDSVLIKICKNNGIHVIHQIGNVRDAYKAVEAGADILIVQGIEAGGHVRGDVSLFGLLPEIVSMSPVPVIAAGGITTGAGMVAAMALGAQGVSCGTLFLATTESNAHDMHKGKVLNAHAADTILCYDFHRNWPMRAAVRVLKNSITQSPTHSYEGSQDQPIGNQDGLPIYPLSTDSPLRGAIGDLEAMALYCGQGCGAITSIKHPGIVIKDLMQQADNYLCRV